jgi:hypothetical protein
MSRERARHNLYRGRLSMTSNQGDTILISPYIFCTYRQPPQPAVSSTEYIEWQRQLSGLHSIMMEKLAQVGEGLGCTPIPFTISTITYKVVVCVPAERADTLPLFILHPFMYSVVCSIGLYSVLSNDT